MRKFVGTALAAVVLVGVGTASAQTRNTAFSRLRMVRAQCTTGPCDPFFTFGGGSALIRRAKQPKMVTNKKLGKVRILELQALGPPSIPASLDASVSGTIWYGDDFNAVCPLANTIVSGEFATSTMNCVLAVDGNAKCSGDLFFTNFTPPACSDVSQVIQNVTVEIYEGGGVGTPEKRIANFGINIIGKLPDCASGGSGCP